ncbi:unnamed protein product [Phaedon cochleariae]|uniref:Acaloleptin A-like n=1 Tax=Phaedon cochleariae TaxID=80249 RepID=A0A9P0GTD3_PHACE|nr:unnamed protein product [Phaedon cochleariae]
MILKLSLILCVTYVCYAEDSGDFRLKRSLQPGAPNINNGNKQQPWEVSPNINRDGAGNVRTDIEVQNHGKDHDFNAGWGKVVRGPGKAKPTWHAGGTIRWRRSLQPGAPDINNGKKQQPWEVSPNINRDGAGNVRTDIEVQNHGKDHDFNAGWGKVVRGPGKAKPTWHAGGTIRWRRSLQPGAPNINNGNKQQPWEVSPNINRDEAGNVRTDIQVQNHGKDHDFNAGWGKVVRGPGKAKPTWHAGGTIRWRRSLQPGAPDINNGKKQQPWEVSPNINRDGAGNVRTDIEVQNHGKDHDFNAGWGKVVRGPGKAKPTWHAGGTIRWRRSLQPGAPDINNGKKQQPWEVSPNINRDGAGNVRTGIEVQNHGKDHDFNAGWGKVVRGPGKAKPTWHAGGTIRWRRSLQPGAPDINNGNKQQPWEVSPNINRDEAGNVRTDIQVQNHGKDHDFNAGWGKVVRGPGRAKPTWHAGGTIRWRRSTDQEDDQQEIPESPLS